MDSSAAISTVTKKIHFASKRRQEAPLKMPFELLANFPDVITDGLSKKHLVGKPRSKFVTKIAEALYCQKSYPTIDEYKHVSQLIVKKWPFLEKTAGQVCNCIEYDTLCVSVL